MIILMDRLKRMSDKLKIKTKNRLSSILSKSSNSDNNSRPQKPPRRNTMSQARPTHLPDSLTCSSGFSRPNLNTGTSGSGGVQTHTLSTPARISTTSSVRLGAARRPTSPNGTLSQFKQTPGLSGREQQRANEKRAVTEESQKCRVELDWQGIKVRDFQTERDTVEQLRKFASTRGRAGLRHQDSGSETVSEEDEVVMRGRKNDG